MVPFEPATLVSLYCLVMAAHFEAKAWKDDSAEYCTSLARSVEEGLSLTHYDWLLVGAEDRGWSGQCFCVALGCSQLIGSGNYTGIDAGNFG